MISSVSPSTRSWLRAQRSEHGAEGGAVGSGSVRHTAKKETAPVGYASHHRPRSGNSIRDHPVSAIEHRPSYQFLAAARNRTV
jgi:hypothetical protein